MKIYLIRHGKDDSNYRGGWSNHPLTEEGLIQAKQVSKHLKQLIENKDNIKLISSDLPRAVDTAKEIANKLNISIIKEKNLREINNGKLAGIHNDIANEKFKGIYFNTLEYDEHYPDGESPNEFYERILNYYNKILKDNNDCIIVTHGRVINVFLHLLKNIKWSNKNKPFKCSNCSITLIEQNSKELKIVYENLNILK